MLSVSARAGTPGQLARARLPSSPTFGGGEPSAFAGYRSHVATTTLTENSRQRLDSRAGPLATNSPESPERGHRALLLLCQEEVASYFQQPLSWGAMNLAFTPTVIPKRVRFFAAKPKVSPWFSPSLLPLL